MKNIATAPTRFLAFLVDIVILVVVSIVVTSLFGNGTVTTGVSYGINNPLQTGLTIFNLLYYVIPTVMYGATPGKKFMKIKVVDAKTGTTPSIIGVILREVVGKFISAIVLFLGFIWIFFDKNKQGWHDKIANTLVVKA